MEIQRSSLNTGGGIQAQLIPTAQAGNNTQFQVLRFSNVLCDFIIETRYHDYITLDNVPRNITSNRRPTG